MINVMLNIFVNVKKMNCPETSRCEMVSKNNINRHKYKHKLTSHNQLDLHLIFWPYACTLYNIPARI